jgi:Protein of unknown function (DUF3465)
MQQLVKLLLLLVLLCFLPSTSIAQKARRTTRRESPPPTICKIASVPNGMVVIGYKRNSACSGGSELLVKQPENGDIICAESPVPPQFSIAAEAQGDLVGTCSNKAFLIQHTSASVIDSRGPAAEGRTAPLIDNSPISRAFASGASDIQVEGEGTVIRVLPDDLNGHRHQRFIVQLASGQTLLVTHNIDIAPRIYGLEVGDSVRFNGEYVWNKKGGVIHWTHHDPQGRHVAGWIKHNGQTFK